MKTRKCFVSNSSTTSFMILGYNESGEEFDGDIIPKIEELGWIVYQQNEYTTPYFGRTIHCMKDNETKREFFNRTKNDLDSTLKDLGIDASKLTTFGWHTDGWRDG